MKIVNKIAIKEPLILFLKLTAIMLAVNFIYEIALVLLDEEMVRTFFVYNPILCGFIHSGPSHLLYNILVLFILLLPRINYELGLKKCIGYTILISMICFPFIALKISLPFIGISGFYYFLLTRYILSLKKYIIIIRILFGIFILSEIGVMGNDDEISHLCHIVGFLTSGILYLKKKTLVL